MPGFLYCLKYPGFGCLHCADRSLFDIISRELERIALAVPWCHSNNKHFYSNRDVSFVTGMSVWFRKSSLFNDVAVAFM